MILTLGALKEQVDRAIEQNERNSKLMVCIPNNKGGMGGTQVTGVVNARKGFDWDNGKFIIYPEVPMIEQTKH